MKKDEFITELTELLDTEKTLSMETVLENVEEWDSLGCVAFLAFCKREGAQDATVKRVREAKTVQDLYDLMGDTQA